MKIISLHVPSAKQIDELERLIIEDGYKLLYEHKGNTGAKNLRYEVTEGKINKIHVCSPTTGVCRIYSGSFGNQSP